MDEKAAIEKMNLSKQLDEDDCTVVFMIIDTMLTKRCLKISFKKTLLLYNQKSPASPGFLIMLYSLNPKYKTTNSKKEEKQNHS